VDIPGSVEETMEGQHPIYSIAIERVVSAPVNGYFTKFQVQEFTPLFFFGSDPLQDLGGFTCDPRIQPLFPLVEVTKPQGQTANRIKAGVTRVGYVAIPLHLADYGI